VPHFRIKKYLDQEKKRRNLAMVLKEGPDTQMDWSNLNMKIVIVEIWMVCQSRFAVAGKDAVS
jgi:hypothetical protein